MSEEKQEEKEQVQGNEPAVMEVPLPTKDSFVCMRDDFDSMGDPKGMPFLLSPRLFKDNRGCFSVSINKDSKEYADIKGSEWLPTILDTTVQVNRSISEPCVFRGFHAQKSPNCQGKLVECLSNTPVWDVIVDARPDASSFKQYTIFKLSGDKMEKVWVPRGFLHGFLVPKCDVVKEEGESFTKLDFILPGQIQYFADNHYSPEDEICVNPDILLQIIVDSYKEEFEKDPKESYTLYGFIQTCIGENLIMSEKDMAGEDVKDFFERIEEQFKKDGTVWYR